MARANALVLTALGLLGIARLVGETPLGLVVGVTVLAVYAAGFVAETAPAGVWAGLVAGGLWGLPVLLGPASTTWAFAAVGFGVLAAAVLGRSQRTSAALTAGAAGALVVAMLGAYVPVLVVGALFAGALAVRRVGRLVLNTTS